MPFKINILVVDDSKANQVFMAHILQKEGLNVVCADSGDQALLKIYHHDFALILMDVVMPGKTGFETAELIRELEKSAGIPIIFVTAFKEDKTYEFKGYEAGAVDFLFKPVDPFILKTKVKIFAELYRREKVLQITRTKLETTLNEQKRLEGQLRQAQKMEAVGTLAGGIAHDFNNILAAIMGHIELAQFELPENNKARHSLNQVLKASHRAKKLVSHILAFSRQSGNEKKPLLMQNIVKEAVDLLRATLPSTISIKQNIDSSFASVKADPTQLHQILMNLGTNAYHAIGDVPGLIEISMGEVRLDKKQIFDLAELNPGHYVRLCVRDNGCGMEPATISKIFDPYFTTKDLLAELGVEHLLHKPLEIKELAAVLRKVLGPVLEVQECRHG